MELNPRLSWLDLSHNLIGEFGVVNLGSLETLDISHNQLHVIEQGAFSKLTKLHTLTLDRNFLYRNLINNSQAFQHLYRLKTLDMSFNSLDDTIVEHYLSNTSSLEHLTLEGNILTRLSPDLFTASRNLRSINVENNLISEIEKETFESLKGLTRLNLARNNLVSICDFNLHHLKQLNLSRNFIEFFITSETKNKYELEMLDLSHNKLIFFPIVPKRNHLKYLNLQNNRIGDLESKMSFLDAKILYREKNSNVFETKGNDDMYFNLNQMPLIDLDLSNNRFTSFPLKTFKYFLSLKSLNLSGNCLMNISGTVSKMEQLEGQVQQQTFPSLRYLDLRDNQIQHLSPQFFEALPNMEKLVLRKNFVRLCSPSHEPDASQSIRDDNPIGAQCTSFRDRRNLKHLDLQDNGIEVLFARTFEHTPLALLDLSHNENMTIAREALDGLQSSLRSLSFGSNRMTSSAFSLPCFNMLQNLDVAENSLGILPDTFACSPLRELDLKNNNLTHLDETVIKKLLLHLNTIHISGNAFNCCTAGWLKILMAANVKIPDLHKATCFTGLNESIFEEPLTNQSNQCPFQVNTEVGGTDLINLTLVIVISLTFMVIALVFLKRIFLKKSSLLTFRSNKVASCQYCYNDQASASVAKISTFETVK
ncbi:leucine-rich repeat-containing protein 32-like [Scleropages formosus]|uniref:Leucine-rich repeat-containing protein 32-like n=2 Tax=Scleropages formosus TaxID=113540 RepID=A0A0P7UE92_SCLFO|nr:leucine-rich repeat-containing protein 32-like [Scleropages formosus]